MMDKNNKQRVKNFFKKEGFYVVLFLCLCIVTTATVISYKKSNNKQSDSSDVNKISLNLDDSDLTKDIPNAEKVENNIGKTNESTNKGNSNNNSSKTVSVASEVKFTKPIEGTLLRAYTYPKPVKVDEDNQRTIRGIDIKASIGTNVKAAEEGIVESAGNNGVEDGVTVVIAHVNGIKTKYTNLEEKVLVKKGDKVTKDTVIGTVGATAKLYNTEEFGEHLNLQVLDAKNEQVDPSKYFDFKKSDK